MSEAERKMYELIENPVHRYKIIPTKKGPVKSFIANAPEPKIKTQEERTLNKRPYKKIVRDHGL